MLVSIWHAAGTGTQGELTHGDHAGPSAQFGNIRKLPSGRFQARYTGPDGHMYAARRETAGR